MSPKSQMAKALPRGLELLRKAGKTNNPKAPGCQNPSACAAPHSMSSARSRAVDFPLSWHLCFSLQALCLLLPEFHFFDCSRQSVLLPTNHPIPAGAPAQMLILRPTAPLSLLTSNFPVPSLPRLWQTPSARRKNPIFLTQLCSPTVLWALGRAEFTGSPPQALCPGR